MNDLEKWFVLKQVGQMGSLKAAERILERISLQSPRFLVCGGFPLSVDHLHQELWFFWTVLRELVGMISAPGHTKNTRLSRFQTCHSSVDMPVVYFSDVPAPIKPAACLNVMISVLE